MTNLEARYRKHTLIFKKPGGTSRGILTQRDSWYLIVNDKGKKDLIGIGECAPLPGLSIDKPGDFEIQLKKMCQNINLPMESHESNLCQYPALFFGLEMALLDLKNGSKRVYFPGRFTMGKSSIPINGLIWMGKAQFLKDQIKEKLEMGFTCLKLKIGSLSFEEELIMLQSIRDIYGTQDLEIRLDANGAFKPTDALEKLARLSRFKIHSIEQPIAPGQWEVMAKIVKNSAIPIALDEELIGFDCYLKRQELLDYIKPHYIILKPTLLGGFKRCENWINEAEKRDIGWWITSALESDIGLNALAQWAERLKTFRYQGLGTGMLFTNNIPSPLFVDNGFLRSNPASGWDLSVMN